MPLPLEVTERDLAPEMILEREVGRGITDADHVFLLRFCGHLSLARATRRQIEPDSAAPGSPTPGAVGEMLAAGGEPSTTGPEPGPRGPGHRGRGPAPAASVRTAGSPNSQHGQQVAVARGGVATLSSRAVSKPLLAACMIIKNEERHLARCLGSLARVADEVVVLDTGSRDASLEIARRYDKVRIEEFPWQDDFSAARNASLDRTDAEWILVVDADEEVVAPADFRKVLAKRRGEGMRVRIINEQPSGALTRSEDVEVVRLFRNHPEHRFEGRVHEQIAPSILRRGGKIGKTDLTIRHYGYVSNEVQADQLRTERNLRLLARELSERPDDYYLQFQLGATSKAHEPERARIALERCIEIAPPDASPHVLEQAHMKLAQLALERGDLLPSAEHAAESIVLNERNVTSRVCAIVSTASLGRLDLARPHLEWIVKQALDEVPNPDDFRALLAQCRRDAKA